MSVMLVKAQSTIGDIKTLPAFQECGRSESLTIQLHLQAINRQSFLLANPSIKTKSSADLNGTGETSSPI
jgi:hypothetical protein